MPAYQGKHEGTVQLPKPQAVGSNHAGGALRRASGVTAIDRDLPPVAVVIGQGWDSGLLSHRVSSSELSSGLMRRLIGHIG